MPSALFRFYEELNDFLPPQRRKRDIELAFEPPVPVRHLIENLGVPHTEVELILINGRSVGLEEPLRDGDRVSVYPLFEALDVTPLLRIRPHPLRDPRFIADAHLGKLAHYLRLLGFDTLFSNDAGDARLAALAALDGRVLLTRDRALLMHRRVHHGCYIRSIDPREQLLQVLRRLDLAGSIRPFTRCMECNGRLFRVEKQCIEADLPIGVARHYHRFWRCSDCARLYWQGHHYRAMRDWIGGLVAELRESV
jgi:uncharacterized protein with PIN domain